MWLKQRVQAKDVPFEGGMEMSSHLGVKPPKSQFLSPNAEFQSG